MSTQNPTPDATATPRTDASLKSRNHLPDWYDDVVSADFARTLERELAAKDREIARLTAGWNAVAIKYTEDYTPLITRAETAEAESEQLRAEVERLGKNIAAIETAGGDEGASARMAMETVDLRAQLAAAQEDRDEHYTRAASLVFKLGDVTCADVRRWRDEYNANLTTMQQTLDWAESLLCNAKPMHHCAQEEWDEIVRKWRDQKHRAAIDAAREKGAT